jgi:hypothetical protein
MRMTAHTSNMSSVNARICRCGHKTSPMRSLVCGGREMIVQDGLDEIYVPKSGPIALPS